MTSPAVTSLFTSPPDPLSTVTSTRQAPPTFDWSQHHDLTKELLGNNEGLQGRSHQSTPPKELGAAPPVRRSSASLQKLSFSPTPLMLPHQTTSDSIKTNPKSAAPREPFVRDEAFEHAVGSNLRRLTNRWSFNGSEKLLDPTLPNWDLVEEIGKLQLSDVTADGKESATTPPKIPTTEVLQIHETSPLDTSSDVSIDSISPPDDARLTLPSHSRGSSTDTSSSKNSAASQRLMPSLKTNVATADVTKDRPRSFSGVYPDAELRRLQQAGSYGHSRENSQDSRSSPSIRDTNGGENTSHLSDAVNNQSQPMFPSLTSYPGFQLQPQQAVRAMGTGPITGSTLRQDELHVDHSLQPRHFVNSGQQVATPFTPTQSSGRHIQQDAMPYRQPPPRGLNVFQPHMQLPAQGPPTLIPSPTNFGYQGHPNGHGLPSSHMSLGNSQQLYEMMLPPVDAGVARAQHVYRGAHHHSASDPATLRDAAALVLSNGMHTMQGASFPGSVPGMYPPIALPTTPLYANQFYPAPSLNLQDAYGQDMINALGRVLPQYSPNGMTGVQAPYSPNPNSSGSTGPSANNRKLGLYKTELCRSWEEKGSCRYGPKCQFAHGEEEVHKVSRHPKYKTEICRTFWVSGSCPYGKRCCFIHTELPASGAPPGADGNPPPPPPDGRARSMSTNSEPDVPVSLLARISAKRNQEASVPTPTTPVGQESATPSQENFRFSKPGSLRVDTTVIDTAGMKQNKSAFPSFVNNPVSAISPGPVTAGPDFGRHNSAARVTVMEMNQRLNRASPPNPNVRHSFNGTEAGININTSRPVSGGSSPFGVLNTDSPSTSTSTSVQVQGHSRSGSGGAGNWGNFSHKGHLAAPSPYSHSPSPGNDIPAANNASSPWGTSELSASATRLNDRPWS